MSNNSQYSSVSEPWYQSAGPSRAEVVKNLFTCLCYKLQDNELLTKTINEIIPRDTEFGSYRGYHEFLHTKYKNDVIERYNYMCLKIEKSDSKS